MSALARLERCDRGNNDASIDEIRSTVSSSQNFTNNLLGWTRNAAANLRMFSSEILRSPRSTSAV
jgi:hypothetical protein